MGPCKDIEGCLVYDKCPRKYCIKEKDARKKCPERGLSGFIKKSFRQFYSTTAQDMLEPQKPCSSVLEDTETD